MAIEIKCFDSKRIVNPQGAETEIGNPFPEVVRETTDQGQVIWLKSSPTSSPEPKSPEA